MRTLRSLIRVRPTPVPFSAFLSSFPHPSVASGALEGYVFAYFTGNTRQGEKIYFAASKGNNALQWEQLNGGQPVLTSTLGTTGLRDPFLIRSSDGTKFFLIATDLSIGSGTSWGDSVRTGSRYLEIWESADLVNWSAQRHVQVSPANAGNTWAPEAYWDDTLQTYVVFWASSLYADNDPNHTGNSYHRMLYATTPDFVTFSAPQIWQDAGTSRIDSTVIKVDGVYHRFTKDEGAGGTGCTDIIQERSTSLTASLASWTIEDTCIGRDAGTSAVEGPTVFRANPNDANGQTFYLFVDEYGGRGYIPLATSDISNPNWKVPASYSLPTSPRHGSVVPITAAELAVLRAGKATAAVDEKREVAKDSSSSTTTTTTTHLSKRSTIIPGLYADPNIAIFGKTAYIYATTDGTPGWGGNTFYVWKSTDLVSWTRTAQPFLTLNGTSGNVPWATGNAWAPTIIEREGKYYFYFSGQNPTYNRKTIGVAVSTSGPEGPFVAQPTAMILNNESASVTTGQAIDPAVFHDPVSGKYYLYWGNGKPVVAQLNDDMVSVNWSTLAAVSGLTDFREGSFVVYRAGLYHMTYSIDDTGSENYRVGYATATQPQGPFTYRGVVLSKDTSQGILATGHDSVVQIPGTDEWYMAYHRFSIPNGDGTHRETTIDRVYFDDATGLMKTVVPTLNGPPARPL
ncbi:glycoside hydrolase family 43 protein-like protein [Microdochium trichocladiopsis]|uniref:Endo-1,5-alpha-L-arabinanase A n=1 Tax=Microdochium trichocladiopsis TaxID=1682393 RepID=A0A9P8YA95_9PEZI|nr:glycoside hydrolase family 43 protein-like protein [Microdochium trichocladiopsis]KAH7033635.1 glycoside hydrolase family 43 protein-like protein [Microdochium trichocladiopsis]